MILDYHPFSVFGLSEGVLAALTRKGFTSPSSIQTIALPRLLADEGHLIVKARTGTGKTAAFGIPLVEKLTQGGQDPRALILAPTRELALQVSREISSFVSGSFPRITAVYGGASIRNQIIDLKRGTEIVVGTPGRIMDLMDRRVLSFSAVEWFILDEADEMLDMGFIEDVEKILASVKKERRVALFSATMPEAILKIVREYIGDVEILEDTAPEDEKPAVDQYYMILKREDRLEALRRIIDSAAEFYGLIFCATKAGADELSRRLIEGGYSAEVIHGDLSQELREQTLRRFRSRRTADTGEASILVATDVAARGLDIERLSHVVNWDLPNDRETYVHRIGRTGRAGRRGAAVSMVLPSERGRVSQLSRSMERTLGSKIVWMKIPSVKSVMKALEKRILASILEDAGVADPSLPAAGTGVEISPAGTGEAPPAGNVVAEAAPAGNVIAEAAPAETAAVTGAEGERPVPPDTGILGVSPPLSRLCRRLIENLGPQGAVEALIVKNYGELLDPARYGPVTELEEAPKHDKRGNGRYEGFRHGNLGGRHGSSGFRHDRAGVPGSRYDEDGGSVSRVYVGLGRRHGASARDVAELLVRAGDVPGRLVDAIEVKDYCAFATLPAEAARRACAFSRKQPKDPVIKPALAARQ
ncbi:MAG: DEAD/DEAH box helicase [Spirochaetaceae bacterium]|jgi:ATP-dependent RNA helicase DeaD|nr:DEAD/DEAH box helicase [Spirochaetaceae bacterium]